MIVCAAIKVIMNNMAQTEHIVCGLRHGDCFKTIANFNDNWRFAKKIQGFIDHKGNFLTREEALIHAKECGQLPESVRWNKEDCNDKELYSEDLY